MISIDIEKKLKTHQGQQVLKIAQQFPSGSITKIYGPSGAGKTTFLKIIAGFIKPEKGTITVDNITWLSNDRLVEYLWHNRPNEQVGQS